MNEKINEIFSEKIREEVMRLEKDFKVAENFQHLYTFFDNENGWTYSGYKLDGEHISERCNYHGASIDGTHSWRIIQVGGFNNGVHFLNLNEFENIAKSIIKHEEAHEQQS